MKPTSKRTPRHPASLAALLLISFASVNTALACDCEPQTGPVSARVARALAQSDAVFSAQVIEVEELPGFERIQIAKLRVLDSWKGPHAVGSVTTTVTQVEQYVCGIEVAVNQTLIVYVSGKAPYRLSTCSRSRALSSATDDIKILATLGKERE